MATQQLPKIRRRLVSMLYEGLVVFSILLIGFLMPQIVLSGFGWTFGPRFLWIHVLLLLMVYFVWCWLNGGQTLPMKTWKLRIINADGLPLRPLQAVLRYLLAWPSILFLGIGIVWAIFDKDRQFLHDRLAGTQIIAAS
jgi:uncharacterized RDD family membrane protein YckC